MKSLCNLNGIEESFGKLFGIDATSMLIEVVASGFENVRPAPAVTEGKIMCSLIMGFMQSYGTFVQPNINDPSREGNVRVRAAEIVILHTLCHPFLCLVPCFVGDGVARSSCTY